MVGLPLTNSALLPCLPVDMAALAAHALEEEIWLTPKPGLVDSENSGSHQDMDLPLFLASIAAIRPWLSQFVILGQQHAFHPASSQLVSLRPAGIACEQAMFTATAGVNTHKGGIFALGLLCSASGRLQGRGDRLTQSALCQEVSAICQGLVARELRSSQRRATVGEKLFAQYGLTGARGEAESGFATVRRHVLPHWFDE
jgi:triphosphoribosyl-dephospho-CoA synthase